MQLSDDFIRMTRRTMGEERFERYAASFKEEVPVSIRLNRHKLTAVRCGDEAVVQPDIAPHDLVCACEKVPWCDDGFYLPQRPNFTFDPLFHAGCYYVQEAASMFIDLVLRQHVSKPVNMLDMCAAPGGKSTAARSALPHGSTLVSNEPIRQRAQILSENMQKWGHPQCMVTNNMPHDFVRSGLLFDVILCDVPCSGEGMFRKDPDTIAEWSMANVEKCRLLQRDIVTDAWKCLADGGILIYSTCTYNILEDEENVQYFMDELNAEVLPVAIGDDWNITGSLLASLKVPVYRFISGISRSEGLFMAVLRKKGNTSEQPSINFAKLRKQAQARLNVLFDGPSNGTPRGKDLVPDHAEALSIGFDRTKYPTAPLSYHEAIAYLRHEAIVLGQQMPRGYVAVTFENVPLGFVKNIGNRANNLYPQEWRIKSTYIPQEYETILRLA